MLIEWISRTQRHSDEASFFRSRTIRLCRHTLKKSPFPRIEPHRWNRQSACDKFDAFTFQGIGQRRRIFQADARGVVMHQNDRVNRSVELDMLLLRDGSRPIEFDGVDSNRRHEVIMLNGECLFHDSTTPSVWPCGPPDSFL